jgi:gamma-glutamyltranspeptidase
VTVPGAIEGLGIDPESAWPLRPRPRAASAIGYAENGFVVAPRVGSDWAEQVGKLSRHAGSAKYYLSTARARDRQRRCACRRSPRP